MYKYSNVYRGEEPPRDKSVLWVHHKTKNDLSSSLIAEIFDKGKWIAIDNGSDSDDSSDGDSVTQIQADWNQSDNTKADYIKNKPTVPPVLLVRGEYDYNEGAFKSYVGEPTMSDAKDVLEAGGIVRAVMDADDDGSPIKVFMDIISLSYYIEPDEFYGNATFFWGDTPYTWIESSGPAPTK